MVDPHIEDVGRSLPTRDPGTCSVGEQVLAATGPCTAGYDSGFPPDDLPVDQAATDKHGCDSQGDRTLSGGRGR
jgi:hypothetical protein